MRLRRGRAARLASVKSGAFSLAALYLLPPPSTPRVSCLHALVRPSRRALACPVRACPANARVRLSGQAAGSRMRYGHDPFGLPRRQSGAAGRGGCAGRHPSGPARREPPRGDRARDQRGDRTADLGRRDAGRALRHRRRNAGPPSGGPARRAAQGASAGPQDHRGGPRRSRPPESRAADRGVRAARFGFREQGRHVGRGIVRPARQAWRAADRDISLHRRTVGRGADPRAARLCTR